GYASWHRAVEERLAQPGGQAVVPTVVADRSPGVCRRSEKVFLAVTERSRAVFSSTALNQWAAFGGIKCIIIFASYLRAVYSFVGGYEQMGMAVDFRLGMEVVRARLEILRQQRSWLKRVGLLDLDQQEQVELADRHTVLDRHN